MQSLNTNSVVLNQNSVVKIGVKIEDVANILREGNAAVITLKNGKKIVVENYFDPAVNESLLVFEGNNGELYWAEFTDSSGQLLDVVKYNPITEEALLGGGATDLLPWIGGALAVGGIAAAVGGSGGSSSSKDSTPVNPMENAERLVSQAEAEYNNALEILEQAQQDGLITPEEQQAVQDAINTAEEAKQVAQDAVNTLPAGTDKEGLQDRLDDLVDIVVPPVNDANENGIDDGDLEAEAAAELVAAAEAARAEQQEILDGLTDADDNGLITPEEYAQAEERLEELQGIIDVAKELAQNAVTGLDDCPAKDTLQDRLDAIEDLVIPAVTDFDGDGDVDADDAAIQAQLDAATTAVEDAEQAYDDLVAAIDAVGDEVSSEERADLLAQLEAAQQAKEDAQALVDALPETIQAEKDALDTRLDGLIDPEIPAVSFAYDDDVNLDMGNEISITAPEIVDQNVQVINLLESTGGIDAGTEVVLSGSTNSLAISISQTSLLAVADAYRVDVLDEAGNIVYSAVTQNSQLVGDVAGLGILGITGDDTLTTTIPDLPAGTYRVVVSNDASALTNLLDTDGGGISLQELGDAGVLLGAGNQEIILEAVNNALGGGAIAGLVTNIVLPPVLQLVNGLPADELVGALNESLLSNANAISLLGFSVTGLLNTIIDATATALLSNTLTLLQQTTITTQVTSTTFENNTVEDNVLANDEGGTLATVTQIQFGVETPQSVSAAGTTINGEYGVLTIYSNGSYTYVGNGEFASIGQSEVFTYTVLNADGVTTDTATLTINILDRYAPDAPTVNPINNINDITGTAEAGSTVIITAEGGNEIGRAVAGRDGLWSIPNPGLTDGTILNAVTIDLAGNSSQTVSTSVDAQAPIANLVTNTTGDSTPILQGTIDDPTATIVVTVDGINYAAVNNGDGTWTLADGQLPELADGNYNVTVQAIDVAGNESTITESLVVEAVLFANDDLNNVNVLDSVLEGNLNGVNGYTFGLLSTDVLSGVVDVNIATNGFRFTVSGDTTQDISIDVSGTTGVDVSIGSVTYANLLLINIDTGEIVATVQNGLKLEPWVLTTRLVANNVEFTNIPEGNYTIGFSSTSVDGFLNSLLEGVVNLNLLSASRITINDSTQYSTADAIGNVLAGGTGTDVADIGDGMRVTEVISAETTYAVNTPIANIGETAIAGSYGILYMQADGSYRYVSNGDANDVAKVDTFTYTVADAAGNTSQAYLNIRTDAEGATIIWNENDLQADGVITVNALDDETTVSIAQINTVSELLSKVEVVGAQATGTNGPVTGTIITNTTWTNTYTLSESFNITENTVANGTLTVTAELLGTVLNNSVTENWGSVTATYTLTGQNGEVTSGILTLTANNSVSDGYYTASIPLNDLIAGDYVLNVNVENITTNTGVGVRPANNGEFTVDTTLSVIETSLNDFTTIEGIYSEEGNLLEDDIVSNIATFTIQQGAEIYRFENGHIYQNDVLLQNQDSVNITGTYGILNVEASGKYTYTTQDGNSIGQIESFTYTVNDVGGLSDTANLNIGIGASITGSRYDDSYSSHIGVADTVIYNVLEGAEKDATGGNGTDIWTDFSLNEGDAIDVGALLTGANAENISEYISVEVNDNNATVISIDRDGTGTQFQDKVELITLEGVNTNLEELLSNGHIIY
ncbi:BapA/Bap/LapF family large adhesin [Acinetobacter schindleri]|uniref:BapA/Bap/LapF family large adhesin n=1 Tax=Acinetobacter schindleri TaxID=108981 RepID=UPI00396A2D8F